MLIMISVLTIGSHSTNHEFQQIIGDYEIYYPLGTKRILYVSYFMSDGKLVTKEEGDKEALEMVQKGSNPLLFVTPKGGMIHTFLKNDSGKVDRLTIKTDKCTLKGIKLLPRVKRKAAPGNMAEKYSVEALTADFNQMVRIMKYLHPSVYDYTAEKELNRFIKEAGAKISGPMAIPDFYRVCAPVVAMMGCAHSGLIMPECYRSAKQARYFPLKVHLLKDRLYVVGCFDESYSHLKGAELLAINGLSVNRITGQMLKSISSDWKNPQFKKYLLNSYFWRLYYYHYGSPELFHVRVQSPENRKLKTLEITGLSSRQITGATNRVSKHPLYPPEPYSITFVEDDQLALMRIRHFSFYQKTDAEGFYKFIDQSFAEIKQKNTKNLLIDIRGNMGGSPFCSSYLLTYLIDKPFQYFIKDRPGSHGYSKFFKLQHPAANLFKGQVITLVDNGCLSTTGHFIGLLKYHGVGKLAGMKTGSTFSCTDGSTILKLRNTGMRLRIARERFTASVKGMPINEGINPDYKIDLTLQDLLDERDLQLEQAITLFRRLPDPPNQCPSGGFPSNKKLNQQCNISVF